MEDKITATLSALSQDVIEDSSERMQSLSPTNNERNEVQNKNILDKKCRGCGKTMERLLRHLKSKTGALCMTKYTLEEMKIHKNS